jgi:hypothetical protein
MQKEGHPGNAGTLEKRFRGVLFEGISFLKGYPFWNVMMKVMGCCSHLSHDIGDRGEGFLTLEELVEAAPADEGLSAIRLDEVLAFQVGPAHRTGIGRLQGLRRVHRS